MWRAKILSPSAVLRRRVRTSRRERYYPGPGFSLRVEVAGDHPFNSDRIPAYPDSVKSEGPLFHFLSSSQSQIL
jgi:hypothetical protein